MKNKKVIGIIAMASVSGIIIAQAVLASPPGPPPTGLPNAQFNSVSAGAASVSSNGLYSLNSSAANSSIYGYNVDPAGGPGVEGVSSTGGNGIVGRSLNGNGVYGVSQRQTVNGGVSGENTNGTGVLGVSTGASSTYGIGIKGVSNNAYGIVGIGNSATTGGGVEGIATGAATPGVYGTNGAGVGVSGNSTSNYGVTGTSSSSAGVSGTGPTGVYGSDTGLGTGRGVIGATQTGYGVLGTATTSGTGIVGNSSSGYGVMGVTNSSVGVFGSSKGVGGGQFRNDSGTEATLGTVANAMETKGGIQLKDLTGASTFKIDGNYGLLAMQNANNASFPYGVLNIDTPNGVTLRPGTGAATFDTGPAPVGYGVAGLALLPKGYNYGGNMIATGGNLAGGSIYLRRGDTNSDGIPDAPNGGEFHLDGPIMNDAPDNSYGGFVKVLDAQGVDVQGAAAAGIALKVNGRIQTGDGSNLGGMWVNNPGTMFVGANGASMIGFYNGGWGLTMDNSGRIDIGSGTLGSQLDLKSATNDALRIEGNGVTYGYNGRINFGDGDYVHLSEVTDDHLEIKSSGTSFVGSVGIGTATPDQTLSVNGNASKVGGGSWVVYSDARLKDVHDQFENGLSSILKLNPIKYSYKKDNAKGLPSDQTYVGLIAQEVQKVIPEAVITGKDGYLSLNNDPIIWTMLNAIKELDKMFEGNKAEMTALQDQVTQLQKDNADLKARLDRLEAKL